MIPTRGGYDKKCKWEHNDTKSFVEEDPTLVHVGHFTGALVSNVPGQHCWGLKDVYPQRNTLNFREHSYQDAVFLIFISNSFVHLVWFFNIAS